MSKIVPRWQAVVFDLDDTLYPEQAYVLSGFRAVADWGEQALGIDAQLGYAQLERLYATGVRGDTFNRWLTHFYILPPDSSPEVSKEAVAPLVSIYREHIPQLQLFAEIAALLPELAAHYRLGLVSDGYLAVQQRKWAALNLAPYFSAVVFSDEWGREAWKPNTKPFTEVLRLLGVEPEDAVYIGDNPLKDFKGARAVGMATIWFKRSGGEYCQQMPPSAAYEPHQIVTSWASLRSELLPSKV